MEEGREVAILSVSPAIRKLLALRERLWRGPLDPRGSPLDTVLANAGRDGLADVVVETRK
jgi:hypothetical protein